MKVKTNNRRFFTIISICFVLIISILIKVATYFPGWIERYYSRGIYPYLSTFYRTIFGWFPFSLGDILYTVGAFSICYAIIKFVKIIFQGALNKQNTRKILLKAFYFAAGIYIYFNIFWGLNYNRPGVAAQLQLKQNSYNINELKIITGILLQKVNADRQLIGPGKPKIQPIEQVFSQAQSAYNSVSNIFPFLNYNTRSVKRSMYGSMGNMLGFLGYYNPFTGEAQLNLTMPRFLVPYVTCHEIAHQLGYASESEANFVGYLAAIHSDNKLFHYSAYFDLFNYANRELFLQDSVASKNNYNKLDTLVKADVIELREYWRKSDNAVEPLIRIFYDNYLKANQQTKGVKSYNEVIGWLIAYYKKYGRI